MAISRIPRQLEINQFYALLPAVNSKFKYIFLDEPVYSLASGDALVGINGSALDSVNELTFWLEVPPNVDNHVVRAYMVGVGVTNVPFAFSGNIPVGTQGLYEFKIPRAKVVEGVVQFHATITDPSTGNYDSTPTLTVKIDLEAPGGPVDPSGVQKNLALVTAALLVPGEISGAELQQGITFTVPPYPGMKQWDTVELKMPGATLRKRLNTTAEVNKPVVFTATPQDLICFAGRNTVDIHYRIVDELGNESQPSPNATFIIDNIQNPQSGPQFVDVNSSNGTISLSSLPGQDTGVRVATSGLLAGEVVSLEWSLVTAIGKTISGTLSEAVISPSSDLIFNVPGNTGLALEAGQLSAYYKVVGRNRSIKTIATLSGAVVKRALSFGTDIPHQAGRRYIILKGRAPLYPAADSNGSYQRQATGGSPPYSYTSSNTAVAKVDSNGMIIAQDNGTAEIIVTDAAKNTASYKITFSGVRLVELRLNQVWSGQIRAVDRPEYHSLSLMQLQSFWEQYRNEDISKSVADILKWSQPVLWSGDNYYPDGTAYVMDFSVLNPDFRGEERRAGGTVLPSLARVGWS